MVSGISLANKCQLIFGFAVVVIIAFALSVPWVRTGLLVEEYQLEVARQLANAWIEKGERFGTEYDTRQSPEPLTELIDRDDSEGARPHSGLRTMLIEIADIDTSDDGDPFLRAALEDFLLEEDADEYHAKVEVEGNTFYRYARRLRESERRNLRGTSFNVFDAPLIEPGIADPVAAMLVVDRTSRFAEQQRFVGRMFIVASGLIASLLATLVFYFILTKLILSPVRRLRETTERVEEGSLTIRADITTGDEFEQLSDAFNAMLDRVEQSQQQLRAINEGLDLKMNELAEANVGLFESNRLKSEFLANVSHELRTPLNSIIGFAELLDENARQDGAAVDDKRRRYLDNILISGRRLLEMINELLDMAKIEAGRMEVTIETVSIADLLEGLGGIMRPQAKSKQIDLTVRAAPNLPAIETDPGKLQQIIYNFVSNAIKFSPNGATVTIAAMRVTRKDSRVGVRIDVTDQGPGIPPDMQDLIFEKFRQIEASHTRAHAGTGLGLAICRELADMLGADVSFVSQPDAGATFTVELPQVHTPPEPPPLMQGV